jgi:hypothetical protein
MKSPSAELLWCEPTEAWPQSMYLLGLASIHVGSTGLHWVIVHVCNHVHDCPLSFLTLHTPMKAHSCSFLLPP